MLICNLADITNLLIFYFHFLLDSTKVNVAQVFMNYKFVIQINRYCKVRCREEE